MLVALGTASYEARAEESGFAPVRSRKLSSRGVTASFSMVGLAVTTALVLRTRALGVLIGLGTATLTTIGAVALESDASTRMLPRMLVFVAVGIGAALWFPVAVAWARWRPATTRSEESARPWSTVVAASLGATALATVLVNCLR